MAVRSAEECDRGGRMSDITCLHNFEMCEASDVMFIVPVAIFTIKSVRQAIHKQKRLLDSYVHWSLQNPITYKIE